MLQVLTSVVFSGAAAIAGATIYISVAPQWRRLIRLAAGHPETMFSPLTQLAHAERRIAVRRWSAGSPSAQDWRAVA